MKPSKAVDDTHTFILFNSLLEESLLQIGNSESGAVRLQFLEIPIYINFYYYNMRK